MSRFTCWTLSKLIAVAGSQENGSLITFYSKPFYLNLHHCNFLLRSFQQNEDNLRVSNPDRLNSLTIKAYQPHSASI